MHRPINERGGIGGISPLSSLKIYDLYLKIWLNPQGEFQEDPG